MLATQLATGALDWTGWRFETDKPRERKFVCITVPHSSNWDGVLVLALARSIGLELSWMIKKDWLRGPMGPVLRRLGAIAIDRSGAHNVVDAMVERLRASDALVVAIPPEGTRNRADHWKSGFYHIARGAQVPVIPGYLCYERKRAGLGPAMEMTGNVHADMEAIRAFYGSVGAVARFPENVGPMRLRDETS